MLAIFQGIAEFLPISSSGHLAVLSNLIGFDPESGLMFGIILHAGSLIAIVVYYFSTLLKFFRRDCFHLLLMVICGSIPTGVGGVIIKIYNLDERLFGDMVLIAIAFGITGMLLRLSGKNKLMQNQDTPLEAITPKQALLVGVAQLFAITPGISRSGSTITAGILSGINREAAGTFSFLLALPAIGGATAWELISMVKPEADLGNFTIAQLIVGLMISAVSSYGALFMLVKIIKNGKLSCFSWYMFIVGILVLLWQIVKTVR